MMARSTKQLMESVEASLLLQQAELAEIRRAQALTVIRQTASGSGDIDHTFGLDRRFRLVFVRCHFVGTSQTEAFDITLDAGAGSAFNATLFTITQAGPARDVHLRIGEGDAQEPSAWTFQADDRLRIRWTNPDAGNITWGLEVGLALTN